MRPQQTSRGRRKDYENNTTPTEPPLRIPHSPPSSQPHLLTTHPTPTILIHLSIAPAALAKKKTQHIPVGHTTPAGTHSETATPSLAKQETQQKTTTAHAPRLAPLPNVDPSGQITHPPHSNFFYRKFTPPALAKIRHCRHQKHSPVSATPSRTPPPCPIYPHGTTPTFKNAETPNDESRLNRNNLKEGKSFDYILLTCLDHNKI